MFATLVGAYPRTPLPGRPFRLRAAYGQLERGEIDAAGFRAVQDELVRDVVGEQIDAGLSIVTDGQVRSDDPQTALARGLEGMEPTGLLRYFDTNTYYRQPKATAVPRWKTPILVEDFGFLDRVARELAGERSADVLPKAVLVGPYSLARLSDPGELDPARLTLALAEALNQELRALVDAGARVIQLDENALTLIAAADDEERSLVGEALERVTRDISGADLTLAVTMGAAVHAGWPRLFELPFAAFLFDLVAGAQNWDVIARVPSDRTVVCGIADARNTRPDDEALMVNAARYAASLGDRGPDRVGLSPSTGLEYLPRDRARAKIQAVGAAARAAAGASGAAEPAAPALAGRSK
jgi:5-methyltetrahydropteroyltriglutamate--homocysteine methyltransferase